MLIDEVIERLNNSIAIDATVKTYGLSERLTVDKKTILAQKGEDKQISIDDDFNAVLWHRLIDANYSPFSGRGSVDQLLISYRVRLLCYSKELAFSEFIASRLQLDNTINLLSSSFDKQNLLRQELPEAQINFDINHYFYSFDYAVKAVIDGRCLQGGVLTDTGKQCATRVIETAITTAGRALNKQGVTINVNENFDSLQYNTAYQTLTFAPSVDWDCNNGQSASITLSGDCAISNPTNLQSFNLVLEVIQDATGGHNITFDTDFIVYTDSVLTSPDSKTYYYFVRGTDGKLRGQGNTFLS